jgi:hypothetical protein
MAAFTGTQVFGKAPRPNLNVVSQVQTEDVSFATKAVLDLDTPSAALDTIIEATTAGTDGNSITIAAVADGSGTGTLTRSGTAFTFHFEAMATTVSNFEALVDGLAGADDLIAVKTTGTGATVLDVGDAFAATALAGGLADNDTLARKFPIDKEHGHWSLHTIIDGTPTGTVKFYYSNLPYPDPDTLTHWVLDSTKTITLSGSAVSTHSSGVNHISEHMLCVVNLTAGSGTVVGWATAGGN